MRMLAMKDILMSFYGCEPSTMALYASLVSSPLLFKMVFGVVVDSKLVPKRKYYLVAFGFLGTLT